MDEPLSISFSLFCCPALKHHTHTSTRGSEKQINRNLPQTRKPDYLLNSISIIKTAKQEFLQWLGQIQWMFSLNVFYTFIAVTSPRDLSYIFNLRTKSLKYKGKSWKRVELGSEDAKYARKTSLWQTLRCKALHESSPVQRCPEKKANC